MLDLDYPIHYEPCTSLESEKTHPIAKGQDKPNGKGMLNERGSDNQLQDLELIPKEESAPIPYWTYPLPPLKPWYKVYTGDSSLIGERNNAPGGGGTGKVSVAPDIWMKRAMEKALKSDPTHFDQRPDIRKLKIKPEAREKWLESLTCEEAAAQLPNVPERRQPGARIEKRRTPMGGFNGRMVPQRAENSKGACSSRRFAPSSDACGGKSNLRPSDAERPQKEMTPYQVTGRPGSGIGRVAGGGSGRSLADEHTEMTENHKTETAAPRPKPYQVLLEPHHDNKMSNCGPSTSKASSIGMHGLVQSQTTFWPRAPTPLMDIRLPNFPSDYVTRNGPDRAQNFQPMHRPALHRARLNRRIADDPIPPHQPKLHETSSSFGKLSGGYEEVPLGPITSTSKDSVPSRKKPQAIRTDSREAFEYQMYPKFSPVEDERKKRGPLKKVKAMRTDTVESKGVPRQIESSLVRAAKDFSRESRRSGPHAAEYSRKEINNEQRSLLKNEPPALGWNLPDRKSHATVANEFLSESPFSPYMYPPESKRIISPYVVDHCQDPMTTNLTNLRSHLLARTHGPKPNMTRDTNFPSEPNEADRSSSPESKGATQRILTTVSKFPTLKQEEEEQTSKGNRSLGRQMTSLTLVDRGPLRKPKQKAVSSAFPTDLIDDRDKSIGRVIGRPPVQPQTTSILTFTDSEWSRKHENTDYFLKSMQSG